jgi:hypothetical protein
MILKKYFILLACACLLSGQISFAQQELPIPIREAAIAELNSRLPAAGRPSSWSYNMISSDNVNLECPEVAQGAALTPIVQVYVIDLVYTNASYTYYVSMDGSIVLPCDRDIPVNQVRTVVPMSSPVVPASVAEFGYVSATCPADFRAFTAPRLQVGGFGMTIAAGDPAYFYELPDSSSTQFANLPQRTAFYILAGPECGEGQVWWKVESEGRIGWTAESRLGGYYFIEPLRPDQVDVTIPPTASPTLPPTLTPTPTATFTPTFTPTTTFTPTFTPTATSTPTSTPTPTPEPIFSPDDAPLDAGNAVSLTPLDSLEVQAESVAWGENILYVLSDGELGFYDPANLLPLEIGLDLSGEPITAIAAEGKRVFIGRANGMLQVLEWEETPTLRDMLPASGEVREFALSGAGQVASLEVPDDGESLLKVWTIDPAEWNTPDGLLMVIPYETVPQSIAFAPDGGVVASFDGQEIFTVEIASGEASALPVSGQADCGGLAFLEETALVYPDCAMVFHLNLPAGEIVDFAAIADAQKLSMNPSGTLLGVQSAEAVVLLDAVTGEEVFRAEVQALDAAFDPAGVVLAVVTADEVQIWGTAE